MGQAKITVTIALLVLGLSATAQEIDDRVRQEQERQAVFRAGMATIVDSLNQQSFDLFVSAIDKTDFLGRIYGLRLIDQRIKKDFSEQMQYQFESLVQGGFSDSGDTVKATLLGVESHADQGRAVVRFDLPDLQFSYHEYELRLDSKNRLVIVDWLDYLQGERYTDGVGNMLVMAAPSRPAARKLIDFQNVKDADLFQFTELLKAVRDRQAQRFVEIISSLNPELQRQRVVVLASVQLSKQIRNRRMLRTALIQMAQYFPEEPLYSLMLLDYYVPSRLFDKALEGLQRTHAKLGFDDAAMEARMSAISLAMGNTADASATAARAVELEPGLELGWWSSLRASVATEEFAAAVTALQNLEQQFGHQLGAAELEKDKSFAALLASQEFASWLETRK